MFMPVISLKETLVLLGSCEEYLYFDKVAIKTVEVEMGVC